MGSRVKYIQSFINRISPALYVTSVTTTYYLAMDQALDRIYTQLGDVYVSTSKVVASFLYIQLMINWIGLIVVKNNFKPSEAAAKIRQDYEQANPKYVATGVPYNRLKVDKSLHFTRYWTVQKDSVKGVNMAYPYWSWRICDKCRFVRPPRSHHCVECDRCVLKRDHHCYYAGNCIGLNNQRHFIVFEFWAVIATFYALIHGFWFLHKEFYDGELMSALDYCLPLTMIRYVTGYMKSFYVVILMIVMYSVTWFFILSTFFFFEHLALVRSGLTTFEYEQGMKHVPESFVMRLQACLGEHWLVNFFIPLSVIEQPLEDGMTLGSYKSE